MNAARLLLVAAAAAVAALFPVSAGAQPPTAEQVQVNDVQVLAGSDSPCPFDISFTGTGTITLTTYYDNTGTPIRQSVHGALSHTIFSAWHTLVSNGPAPVHIELAQVAELVHDDVVEHLEGRQHEPPVEREGSTPGAGAPERALGADPDLPEADADLGSGLFCDGRDELAGGRPRL